MEVSTTLKRNNKGTTLAEMIVTFALVGIFLVAASGILVSAVLVHSQLTATMYAQSAGETILDKIAGELGAAKNRGETGVVIKDGQQVSYLDRDGNPADILVKDGVLVIHYQELSKEWKLEDRAYMGYRISELKFHKINEKNVMEISVKLKNQKTGFEYAASRCTKCYHFKTEEDFQKIIEK